MTWTAAKISRGFITLIQFIICFGPETTPIFDLTTKLTHIFIPLVDDGIVREQLTWLCGVFPLRKMLSISLGHRGLYKIWNENRMPNGHIHMTQKTKKTIPANTVCEIVSHKQKRDQKKELFFCGLQAIVRSLLRLTAYDASIQGCLLYF